MNDNTTKFRLSPSQTEYIQQLLPRGYCLIQTSNMRRQMKAVLCNIETDRHNPKQILQCKNDMCTYLIHLIIMYSYDDVKQDGIHSRASVQEIKEHEIYAQKYEYTKKYRSSDLSLEEELYARSPNVLTDEQRRCYVVLHKLKRHAYYQQFEDRLDNKESDINISLIERHVMEGPTWYTSLHFWSEWRSLFALSYKSHECESVGEQQTQALENYFNEIYRYVNESQRSILNNLGEKRKALKVPPTQDINEQDMASLEEGLLQLNERQLSAVWFIISEQMDTPPHDEICFELDQLSAHTLRKLEAYVHNKLKRYTHAYNIIRKQSKCSSQSLSREKQLVTSSEGELSDSD